MAKGYKGPVIEGMTCDSYDPDLDIEIARGDIGIRLANAAWVRENGWRNHDVGDTMSVANKRNRYVSFLEESAGVNSSPFADREVKQRLLVKYFPGRFGDEGQQPIREYGAGQIGFLYRNVTRTAQKKRFE